ncbi:ParA family protein [Pedobacter aquatilis]|uniref:ParA family protein n=1 Tax=Pedobacter aquatilis TaxID=351343 RepID=UPI00293074B9|nr:ParA family protein [Pedobacter aquatilis]
MRILIGNQKGGAGKSTLTLLLANYLAIEKRKEVLVLDLDYQASISVKSEKAKLLENPAPYEVIHGELASYPEMLKTLERYHNQLVIIDLPGKMDDDALIPVILSGDLIICPFNYDEFSVDSSLIFAMVCARINCCAKIIFLPNRIKTTVRYETRAQVDKALENLGVVFPEIPDRIDFQRVSTIQTPLILRPLVERVLERVYKEYINPAADG